VTYAGSVQQTDESRAQEVVAQDPSMRGFFGDIFRPGAEAAAKANADKSASQYATSQAQGLGHDITTKPGPHTGADFRRCDGGWFRRFGLTVGPLGELPDGVQVDADGVGRLVV
jgi:hypothetical protein